MQANQIDFNPFLSSQADKPAHNVAGKGSIELPGQVPNLRWQTRAQVPSEAENSMAEHLIQAFEQGAVSAQDIIMHWLRIGFTQADGQAWNEASLISKMKEFAQDPGAS